MQITKSNLQKPVELGSTDWSGRKAKKINKNCRWFLSPPPPRCFISPAVLIIDRNNIDNNNLTVLEMDSFLIGFYYISIFSIFSAPSA